MTPEPKDVQLARAVIQAGVGANGLTEAIVSSAHTVVANHEANIEAGRKQAEERQRAIEETARRWPELKGWRYVESEYYHTMSHNRYCDAYISKQDGRLTVDGFGDGGGETDTEVALALIDAAGRNATADRLRKAIVDALECIDGGVYTAAEIVLKEALEASNG